MTLHTQREEDIKSYQDKFCVMLARASRKDAESDEDWLIKNEDFISNIYINIAENQIKKLEDKPRGESWAELNEHEQWGYRKAQIDEITYWQEELNKLK